MVFLMLLGIVFVFLFSYKFVDKDFLSPANVFLLFSIVSITAMFIFYDKWELSNYGLLAVVVYLSGSIFFVVGCGIAKAFSLRNINLRNTINSNVLNPMRIEMSYLKIFIAILISLAGLYGTYRFIMNLVGGNSLASLAVAVQRYRYLHGQRMLSGENAKGRIWALCSSFSTAFAYCSIIVLIHNIVNRKYKRKDLLLVFPFAFKTLEYLITSSRGDIINMLVGAIMCWFISMKFRRGWNKEINRKVVKIVIRVAIIFVPLFFGSLIIMGRVTSLKGFDFTNSAVIYLSGGVRNLDLYFKEPITTSKLFGEETFTYLLSNLSNTLQHGKLITRVLEFRNINGKNIGNIYTSFRRFYHDFGFLGVCFLSSIQGMVISSLYYNINRRGKDNRIGFLEVLYYYLACTTPYIAIEDTFFSYYFSITCLKMFVIFFIVYFFIYDISSERVGVIKINFGNIRIRNKFEM